jgi:peroxiredoxin Q/BCP
MISMDDQDTLKRWAQELKVTYPILSDATGRVAQAYGVMMPGQRMAVRTTFIIDKSGVIREIQQGNSAIDTSGALAACARVSHQKPEPGKK